jgi:hypothetical protein
VIVLDENLQVLRLRNPIAAWYPGRVCYIIDLDPGAVIKDEAVPTYLRRFRGVTFVTTNVSDFWRALVPTLDMGSFVFPCPMSG